MFVLIDGTSVTRDDIEAAFNNGQAVIVCGRKDNGTSYQLALDGRHFDTRGQCYSMWDEQWTVKPKNMTEALNAGYFK